MAIHSDFSCVIREREPRNCVTESFGRWSTINIAAKADKINSLVNLDPEELGARLGGLEMEGYVKTKTEMDMERTSLPNGISAAGLTNQGRQAYLGQDGRLPPYLQVFHL